MSVPAVASLFERIRNWLLEPLGAVDARQAELQERLLHVERQVTDLLTLTRIIEQRSRTLQHVSMQAEFAAVHGTELLHKWYVESADRIGSVANVPPVLAARRIRLETAHPLALASQDHLAPDSTVEGIGRPTEFVAHCAEVVGRDRPWLDIGAGAAGFVYEAVTQGIVALGLDGSDHCRRNRIGYWPLLPDNLRTCDVTRPFEFRQGDGSQVRFSLVTMWEVLEHIGEADLPQLLANVTAHLPPDGYFIGSISLLEYASADGVPYHLTLKPREWWAQAFAAAGLRMSQGHPFNERLFYRGNGPRFQDMHNYHAHPEEGFHFVARRAPEA